MSKNTLSHRVARRVVGPLASARIAPDNVTTARLVTGVAAVAAFAVGSTGGDLWGGILFVLSAFLDRVDGELARRLHMASPEGDRYDVQCDLVVTTLLFTSIGIGLRQTELGSWSIAMGVWTSCWVLLIYWLRSRIEGLRGVAPQAPAAADSWFDPDDFLYLVGPVAWWGFFPHLLIAAVVGTPVYALGALFQYQGLRRAADNV